MDEGLVTSLVPRIGSLASAPQLALMDPRLAGPFGAASPASPLKFQPHCCFSNLASGPRLHNGVTWNPDCSFPGEILCVPMDGAAPTTLDKTL